MRSNEYKNGIDTCKMEVLGSKGVVILPKSAVGPVCAPDPSEILQDINAIDANVLQEKLSQDNLKNIWDKEDTTYTKYEKLFLYWHQCTRHITIKYVKRLALRGVIPCRFSNVKQMPMCTACKLADATKRKLKAMRIRNR